MMKKILLIVCTLLLISGLVFFINTKSMIYVYANPYTETSGFPYIANIIKQIDNILNQTKISMILDNKNITYIYKNPYGSGFLRNNAIPNDLDYSVGINIGDYYYDGNNAKEIATEMIDKINAFYFYFISNITSYKSSSLYYTTNPFDMLRYNNTNRAMNISDIEDSLDYVVKGEYYIKTTKPPIDDPSIANALATYLLKPYEIIIQKSTQIILYSDLVAYNSEMPHYLREISIMPEFFATIKTSDKKIDVELVPEVHWGTRMQLSRRCFGSTVFNSLGSLKFLNNVNWLNNDDDYIETRKLSFIRHLNEITNIISLNKSPVKVLKRIMQTAEIIRPMLTDEEYDNISNFVKENLSNPSMVKLNELANIYNNITEIVKNKNIFVVSVQNPAVDNMRSLAEQMTADLDKCEDIDKSTIAAIKSFNKYLDEKISDPNIVFNDLELAKDEACTKIFEQMNKILTNQENFAAFSELFHKIYYNAGYHRSKMVWYGDNDLAILKDDFTKNIKDLNIFVEQNGLPKEMVNKIKFLDINTIKAIPDIHMSYATNIRYDENNDNPGYKKLVDAFLSDKKSFNPKLKFVFVK